MSLVSSNDTLSLVLDQATRNSTNLAPQNSNSTKLELDHLDFQETQTRKN